VSDDSFESLLSLKGEECDPDLESRLRIDELHEVQKLSEKVEVSTSVIELCKEFRNYLRSENIYVSDRRWRKIIKLLKVSAFTSGQTKVTNYDAWIMAHCLWEKPEQLAGLQEVYTRSIAIDGDFSNASVTKTLTAWEGILNNEKEGKRQKVNAKGKLLYVSPKGKETIQLDGEYQKVNADGKLLYIDRYDEETTASRCRNYNRDNSPCMVEKNNEPLMIAVPYSQSHIQGRIAETVSIQEKIQNHLNSLEENIAEVDTIFDNHIWVDQDLKPEVVNSYQAAKEHTEKLVKRAEKLVKGFESLPLEEAVSITDDVIDMEEDSEEALEGDLCD
jgi:MoxR-like ATPase